MMTGRTRVLLFGAVALVVCAAAGAGIWRALDPPAQAGSDGIRGALAGSRAQLMSVEGVLATGIGERAGEPVIRVYVADPSATVTSALPDTIDGYPVVTTAAAPAGAPSSADGGSQPGFAGVGTSGSAGSSEPGGTAGSTTPVPVEPDAGSGSGAGTEPGETTGLDLRGTVTSAAVCDVTSPGQAIVGSILVEGPQTGEARYDKASVTITKDTRLFAQVDGHVAEVHPAITDLRGKRVEVGFTGPVAESYPVQATAAWITILD
jgi:hypothetical protein